MLAGLSIRSNPCSAHTMSSERRHWRQSYRTTKNSQHLKILPPRLWPQHLPKAPLCSVDRLARPDQREARLSWGQRWLLRCWTATHRQCSTTTHAPGQPLCPVRPASRVRSPSESTTPFQLHRATVHHLCPTDAGPSHCFALFSAGFSVILASLDQLFSVTVIAIICFIYIIYIDTYDASDLLF